MGDDGGDMYSRICAGEWEFDVEEFEKVSTQSKDLVRSLLKVDALERFTVEQALRHQWFSIDILSGEKSGAKDMVVDESASVGGDPLAKRQKTGEPAKSFEGPVVFLSESMTFRHGGT